MLNLDELMIDYMHKLEDYWKDISRNKKFKRYQNLLSMTHLSGIHIDFYHKPYLYINKKYPELIFRNVMFKKIIHLNRLLYKEIYLPKEVIETMIEQCNMIELNHDYWARQGFNEFQINMITDTYVIFKNYLNNYLKYQQPTTCVGLGKTSKGDELFEFIIKYNTGFQKMTAKYLQDFALKQLAVTIKKIEEYTKKSFAEAKKDYESKLEYYKNESDFLGDAKLNIFKLHRYSQKLFDKDILMPFPDEIKIKPIPKLRAVWGSKGKAQEKTIFLNTEYWDKIDKDLLLKICAHEALPGHILEKNNTNKIFDKYVPRKKLKKYMMRGIPSTREGWASFSELLIVKLYNGDNKLIILFHELYQVIRMIVDIGINSASVQKKFNTVNEACEFMKEYLISDMIAIKNDVLRCLGKPGQSAAYGWGYFCVEDMFLESKLELKTFNSLFMKMPLTLSLMEQFIKDAKDIKT
jgi:uncharacterized protein (DUF885 family)